MKIENMPIAGQGLTHSENSHSDIYQPNERDISVIKFEGVTVRVVNVYGDPWFVAKDVCKALEVTDHLVALRRLDSDEKGGCLIPTPGGNQVTRTVCESGFYKLIARSRKATTPGTFAHRFTNWVFRERDPIYPQNWRIWRALCFPE